MRAFLLILIIAVVAVIAALATGFLNINQIRGAQVPEVATTGKGVTARGGQTPAFDVQTGSVRVESKQATVKVPTVVVQKPGDNASAAAAATTNNAM